MNLRSNMRARGKQAEDAACLYLKEHGLVLITRNYCAHGGEIDLIMREGEITVFVEVRSRASNRFMHAVETIDNRKRARIVAASQEYLQKHRQCSNDICRYDLLLLLGKPGAARMEWIKNAFDA